VRPDDELLFIARPNQRQVGTRLGGDIAEAWHLREDGLAERRWDVRFDRQGFRNPDALTAADVCMVGDSFVVGDRVTEDQTMTSILANRLGVSVANLGQIGYGPQQELGVLRRFAFAYRPRLVIWVVFEGNDLVDTAWYETARPRWADVVAKQDAFVSRSFLGNAVAALRRLAQPEPEEAAIASARWGRLPDGRRMWFLRRSGPWSDWELAALDVLGDALAEGQRTCAARGVRLLVVFAPDKFRVYGDVCVFPEHSECRTWQQNDFPDRLHARVRAISPEVGFLDLTPSFRERARAGDVLYPPDDTHWSAAGQSLAADVLAAYVRERGLLESGARSTAPSSSAPSTTAFTMR